MRKFLVTLAALAAICVAAPAFAGKTQVDPDDYKANGTTGHVYGRSDGIFQENTTHAPYIFENGTSAGPLAKGYRETFAYGDGKGLSCIDGGDGSTCAGDATTVPGVLTFGSGLRLIQFPVVTATLAVDMDADGLDIAGDQTEDDGFELAGGILGASGRPFVIGDDPAFYFCATLKITDIDGTDDLQVGFRIASPFTAAWDDYTDGATLGVNTKADPAALKIATMLNNAGTVETDTTQTWAENVAKKFCVYVSGAGVVTYKIDGAAPTATAAFTFDDGDEVIPFVRYLHTDAIADAVYLSLWEVGYQE